MHIEVSTPTVAYGGAVRVIATVKDFSASCNNEPGNLGCDWPTGQVQLYDYHVAIPGAIATLQQVPGYLFPTTVAEFELQFGIDSQFFSVGDHYLTASYEPGNFDRISEATWSHDNGYASFTIIKDDCTLALSVNRPQTTGGDTTPVVFAADLGFPGHAGTVDFLDGASRLYGRVQITDGRTASLALSPVYQLPDGTTTLHAVYYGDDHYNPCTSGEVSHTIVPPTTASGEVRFLQTTPDSYTINVDEVFDADVLANDRLDLGNGPPHTLTIPAGEQPQHGTALVTAQNTIRYTPDLGYEGPDSMKYHVVDRVGNGNDGTVDFTIVCMPGIADDSYTVSQDTPLNAGAPAVLANDTPCDGAVPSVVTPPANGTVAMSSDGSFVYTPNAGYSGLDSFTYQLSTLNGSIATVSLRVAPAACSPSAADDSYDVTNGAIDVAPPGVAQNDLLCGAIPQMSSATSHGTVTLFADGAFKYQAASGYSGPDSFTYQLGAPSAPGNGFARSALAAGATVHLNVVPIATSTSSSSTSVATTVADETTTTPSAAPTTPSSVGVAAAVGATTATLPALLELPSTGTPSASTLVATALVIALGLACLQLARRRRTLP